MLLRPEDPLALNPKATLETLGPHESVGLRELELIRLNLIAELSHVDRNLAGVRSLAASHSNLLCLLPEEAFQQAHKLFEERLCGLNSVPLELLSQFLSNLMLL